MWFDQRKTYDPNTFNYDTDQQELQQRQAMAKQLMNAKTPEGQMIGKHYVGPGVLGHLATVLQAYIGSKANDSATADQKSLDEASQKAFREGIANYMKSQNPGNYTEAANAAAPLPQAGYTYKDPSAVGPQQEFAVSSPVRSGTVENIPLPPDPPVARAPAPATNFQSGGGGRYNGNGATGSWGASQPQQGTDGSPTSQDKPGVFSQQAKAAQDQFLPIGKPANEFKPEDTFTIQQPTAEEVAAAKATRASFLQKAIAADKEKALDLFERSGKRGQVFSQALLAKEMTPAELTIEKIKRGDEEVLVGINPRTGQTAQLTQASGAQGREDRKAKIEEVNVFGQQREHVAKAEAAVTAADTSVKSLMDAVGLAKDVNINNIAGQKWEQVKGALKLNPKYTALGYIAGDGMLEAAQQMKGSISDKDMAFIKDSRPTKDATVAEWLAYAQRVTPILQAAQQQSRKLHEGAVTTARELGIPEFQPKEDAAPAGQPQTRFDWRR